MNNLNDLISMTDINKRVYLKGLENGNWCWPQIGDIKIDDLESASMIYNVSPLTFIEVR